jgi:adenylate kinase family enzyme
MESVTRWLLDLGIQFNNIEEDFSNGYLLGMILFRYNFQPDFGQFSNKVSYALTNLSKIQLSLERLAIKFDPHRLINKEPGYSQSLLAKIYKALHNVPDSTPAKKKGSLSLPPEISKQDRLGERQKKFEDFHQTQLKIIKDAEFLQRDLIFNAKIKERQNRIDVLKTNKTFMQTWQGEGIENWKKNVQIKKERVLHEKTVKLKLSNDKKTRIRLSNQFYLNDTFDGIKEFEKNMIRLGIDYTGETEKKVTKQDLSVETAATMAKIKENKLKSIEAAKEREVRQRNSYIEQKKNEKFESYKKSSSRIGNLLKQVLSRLHQNIFLFLKNYSKKTRRIQDVEQNISQYKNLAEEKWGSIERARLEALEAQEQIAKKEISEKKKNFRKNVLEAKLKASEMHFEMIKPVTYDLIALAGEVFEHLGKFPRIPSKLWNNWMEVFVNKANQHRVEVVQKPEKDLFESVPVFDELGKGIVEDYLNGRENWGPLPSNYLLSDCIEEIIDTSFPLSPRPPFPEGPSFLPLKLLLLGGPFSGKHHQSKKLSDTFFLKSLEQSKIQEEAKKVVLRKSEPEDTKNKKKVIEEEPEVFIQACLESNPDEESGRARLFRGRIRGLFGDSLKSEEDSKKPIKKEEARCQGFILLGYPGTLQEAVDLERQLSGFVHPSELPAEQRDVKKVQAGELIRYRPKEFVPQKMFSGFWDLVVILDVDEDIAARRAAERRIDPAGNVYNLMVNPPPDNVLAKCKTIDWPGEDWLHGEYAQFTVNKNRLAHWFSLFGFKGQSSFMRIDGNSHPDVVFESIKIRCLEILAAKNTPGEYEEKREGNQEREIKAFRLFEMWEKIAKEYKERVFYAFGMFRGVVLEMEKGLVEIQEEFLMVLKENDLKGEIAKEFLADFNDLIRRQTIFSKGDVDELLDRIDNISDSLWDLVSQRKQKMVELRQKLVENYNIEKKLGKFANLAVLLTQCEAFKYSGSANLILDWMSDDDKNPQINLQIPSEISFPLSDFLKLFKLKALNSLTSHSSLSEENELFEFRVSSITAWVEYNLNLFRQKTDSVFNKLDDWIKQAVILLNDSINDYISALHSSFKSKEVLNYSFPPDSSILKPLSI